MDDENLANLDKVFKSCQNNLELFFAVVVEFVQSKTDFSKGDSQHILLKTFAKVENNHKGDKQQQLQQTSLADTAIDTFNGTADISDNTSCDLFDDPDLIIPETQDLALESNDSGESICIPLYNAPKDVEINGNNHSDDDSEYAVIRPESNLSESMKDELQSQQVFIDPNLIRDLETSGINMAPSSSISKAQSSTHSVEPSAAILKTVEAEKYDAADKHWVDRSGSTTPDIDFHSDETGKDVEMLENNRNNDETQNLSDSFFDAHTQQVNRNETEDIFAAATQLPVFKYPSMPPALPKQKHSVQDNDSVYAADTQILQEDDDIFDIATQIVPSERPSTSSTIKTNTNETSRGTPKKTMDHDKSDDIFEIATQLLEEPEDTRPASPTNRDHNGSDIFDVATQMIDEPDDVPELPIVPKKRFPTVCTQSSQPANTPEWSVAARLSNAQIEQYEKTLAANEAAKKKNKLKKHRFLFATSSDEEDLDEDDDDLEFDLPKPTELVTVRKSEPVEDFTANKLKRTKSEANGMEQPAKKPKPSENVTIGSKIGTRRLSVKVSRAEVQQLIEDDARNRSNKPRTRDPIRNTESDAAKVPEQRSSRQKKSEPIKEKESVEVRQSKRNKCPSEGESPQLEDNKHTDDEKRNKSKISNKTEPKASKKYTKSKATPKSKSNDPNTSTGLTITNTNSTDFLATSVKRRHSTRQSSRLGILFTQVNPLPYTNVIPNLGGFIVDTPQLGNVLICDKISRTFKFLYALSKGIPIVSSRWLDISAKNHEFEPTEPYLTVDKTAEKRFNFRLKNSLEAAKRTPLFSNYHIFATQHVQPTTDEISEIVECSGGKFANNTSMKRKPNSKAVLISHKKDSKLWPKYREFHPDIQIVSSEGFMQSVVQQRIIFSHHILE